MGAALLFLQVISVSRDNTLAQHGRPVRCNVEGYW